MLRYIIIPGAITLTLGVMALNVGPATAIASPKAAPKPSPQIVAADLVRIDELRRVDLIKYDDQFSMDHPGLTLTFTTTLPEGHSVIDITNPKRIMATDSSGRDLTTIKPRFGTEKQFIEMKHTWEEDAPTEFELHLALPDRAAGTLSVKTTVQCTTHEDITTIEVPVSNGWTDLDSAAFGGKDFKVQLGATGSMAQVTVVPGMIRPHIEKIELTSGGQTVESTSSMWNDESCQYHFDTKAGKDAMLKLTVRTGLQVSPLTISLEDQPLP